MQLFYFAMAMLSGLLTLTMLGCAAMETKNKKDKSAWGFCGLAAYFAFVTYTFWVIGVSGGINV